MTFPTSHVLGAQRNGVNHVSMNLGSFDLAKGPDRGTNYPVYSDALLDWYQAKGVASVRLVFTWEAVQVPPLGPTAPVPAAGVNYAGYWNDLMDVVKRLLSRGIFVTLALWQYNPDSGDPGDKNKAIGDTDIVYNGSSFTADNFSDFWRKFVTAVNAATRNDPRISFDLINEPHTHEQSGNKAGDIGIELGAWFALAQAAIGAIRAAGATNTIFVPGMSYSDAKAFTTNGSAEAWLALSDPSNNIAVTVHNYNGLGTAEPTAVSAACGELVAWARSHSVKVQVGEVAIDAGANGQPPFASNLPTAEAQWADWQQFCLSNADVLVGWHWWGNSAQGWWDAGDSQNGLHWGLTLDDGATQTVYADLIEGTFRTSVPLTRPLVVPEYETARVTLYVCHPITGETVAVPPYLLDLQRSVSTLFPGRTAKANSCALLGDDLFVSNSSADSQCVFKVADYLVDGGLAAAEMFVFTLDGSDYVGLAFDAAGNLYAAEGSFLDNRIVRYAGTDIAYPGPGKAMLDNYAGRLELGNAGLTSYFANLAFDATGNLWVSDYLNHRLVVFDAADLGVGNGYHSLGNLSADIPVANTDPALASNTGHLFASPEGLAFDTGGNLWVANNNDGAQGVQNDRTSLVVVTPALQAAVLGTPPKATGLQPAVEQSGSDYLIYQVPNLADDTGPRPQLGGLQIDRSAGRLYVNEEVAGNGRAYDLVGIAAIGTQTEANDVAIVSTNPGNGGIALVERDVLVVIT